VAGTLSNLGVLDSDQGRMEEARKEYAEALQTYRELAHKNPETYQPDVAGTLNNLGVLDRDQGRMEEARKEYAEALQIRRELAQKNPETYQPYVAGTPKGATYRNGAKIGTMLNRKTVCCAVRRGTIPIPTICLLRIATTAPLISVAVLTGSVALSR
jgi:tetratricopeptide (TPR) repeat protein